jgi:hypothetical protein
MPDFLTPGPNSTPALHSVYVLGRLLLAGVLGFAVAWIYRRTRKSTDIVASFPTTLVLLCILIAMVTQVIGESVARAFSLVGALSIVRFRTVVRDTQDTAYVIFAVAVGMAVGAQNPIAAFIGIAVVGIAAFLTTRRGTERPTDQPPFTLNLRLAIGQELEPILRAVDPFVQARELVSMGTAKQGAALDAMFETRLRPGCKADDVIKALNKMEGVQSVSFERQQFEQ